MNEGRFPRRCYCVRCDELYPLHCAALAVDVEEGRLHRAILFEDLDAIPVPDDRQYLIRGRALRAYLRTLRPSEECELTQDQELVFKPGFAMLLWVWGVLFASVLILLTPLQEGSLRRFQGPLLRDLCLRRGPLLIQQSAPRSADLTRLPV